MNDDFDTALFEPELILSPQMTEDAQDDGDTSGERALMLAILEDAMRCIERGRRRRHPRTRQLAAEAETWVRSDSREWLFSFASICDVLGIDPDAFRVRLLTPVGRPAIDARAARPEADEHGLRRFDEMLGAAAPAPEDLPALLGAHPGHVAVDAPAPKRRWTGTMGNRLILEPDGAARLCSRLLHAESVEPVPRREMCGAAGHQARTS